MADFEWVGRPAEGSPWGSHFDTLDRQALEIRGGFVGIENLAVEELFLAA